MCECVAGTVGFYPRAGRDAWTTPSHTRTYPSGSASVKSTMVTTSSWSTISHWFTAACVAAVTDGQRPGANDILWLFRKWDHWVAGHANKETKQIQDVLDEARLVWSTRAQRPWTKGYHDWGWVDHEASKLTHALRATWFCGSFRTRERFSGPQTSGTAPVSP